MIVSKKISDEKMVELKNTYIKPSHIDTILTKDTVVYTEDGKLLLVFKKNKVKGGQDFYNTTSQFVKSHPSSNRGSATGSSKALTMSSKSLTKSSTGISTSMNSIPK